MCWYCTWGLPKPVADVYKEALDRLEKNEYPLLYGPAHIVWDDYNLSDNTIRWCVDNFDEYRSDYTDSQMRIVKWSLLKLLRIPEKDRDIEPDIDSLYEVDYRDYPPPAGVVMVKV